MTYPHPLPEGVFILWNLPPPMGENFSPYTILLVILGGGIRAVTVPWAIGFGLGG
jgi:hypothetical protein